MPLIFAVAEGMVEVLLWSGLKNGDADGEFESMKSYRLGEFGRRREEGAM